MTLIACALLGLEAASGPSALLIVLLGMGGAYSSGPYLLLGSALGMIGGCVLGLVLLRQGGISIPSREQRGATRGALVGFVVGVLASFFGTSNFGTLGICVLIGLAVGRAFDRSSIQPTS